MLFPKAILDAEWAADAPRYARRWLSSVNDGALS